MYVLDNISCQTSHGNLLTVLTKQRTELYCRFVMLIKDSQLTKPHEKETSRILNQYRKHGTHEYSETTFSIKNQYFNTTLNHRVLF